MKKFKLLLIAVATIGLTSFYACGSGEGDEATDSTVVSEEVIDEPVIEEAPDSTAVVDSLAE
jgi:hypothetical protein